MTYDVIRRRIADLEVERHKADLLYADRQQVKQARHDAVIARLRRRKYVSLCGALPVAVLMVVFGGIMSRMLAVFLVANTVHEYTQIRRTEEILRRLAGALEAADGRAT